MAKRVVSARALRFLFASGVLRGKGSGKKRTVTYDKARAATISRNRKRGVDVTSRKKASQTNKSGRHVFGGSKAARLRSGSAPARRVPSKAERDATRASRIAAGQRQLEKFAGRQASAYKQRFNPIGDERYAKKNGRFDGEKGWYRKGERIYVMPGGGASSRQRRPRMTKEYGRTGTGEAALRGRAADRRDGIQRAAAAAVGVTTDKRRGRAYANREMGKNYDLSRSARTSEVATRFRENLKSVKQARRKGIAEQLREARRQDPTGKLAREKLGKFRSAPKFRELTRNPYRK